MSLRLVVYTAIFDIGDQLHPVPGLGPDVAFHCYTDVQQPWQGADGWWRLPAVWAHPTKPRLRARRHKLMAHQLYPHVEYTLWVDGCLTPTDPDLLLRPEHYLAQHDLCVFKHMQRDCIYAEMDACLELKKDSPDIIERLRARYTAEKYPVKRGLAETTAVLRRTNDLTQRLNEAWWAELSANSIRDQLSFDYVCWRQGRAYNTFAGTRCASPHFRWRPHR
jgi:hypothetical protein